VTVTGGPRGADLTCEQVIRLMADYLESALTPERIAELEAHLEGCEPCVTAQTERVEMPEELTIRLRRFFVDKLLSKSNRGR
jgi:anti-sigma factor RsiW